MHQDVNLYVGKLDPDTILQLSFDEDRKNWVQVAKGKVDVNGTKLETGDGAEITDEEKLAITAEEESEILFFDLRQ